MAENWAVDDPNQRAAGHSPISSGVGKVSEGDEKPPNPGVAWDHPLAEMMTAFTPSARGSNDTNGVILA